MIPEREASLPQNPNQCRMKQVKDSKLDMMDRQVLFEKFLNLLQTEPLQLEYLAAEPKSVQPFDPYQMVAEWIALRHEIKQQGKLLQTNQNTLQQAFKELQSEKEHWQQLESSQRSSLTSSDQKALWRDLLGVVDALDQADAYWQEQIAALTQSQPQPEIPPEPFWKAWLRWLTQSGQDETISASASLREVLVSNQQGVGLIRRSLLNVLQQRQVIPIAAQGQPFDSRTMYALGRQESTSAVENTVIREVVRGYLWEDQVLREAQVIVAVRAKN
jgi:molecular chaperone GrpE